MTRDYASLSTDPQISNMGAYPSQFSIKFRHFKILTYIHTGAKIGPKFAIDGSKANDTSYFFSYFLGVYTTTS